MIGGKKSKDFLTRENDMDLRFQRPDGAVLARDPTCSLLWSVGLLICALRKVQSPIVSCPLCKGWLTLLWEVRR